MNGTSRLYRSTSEAMLGGVAAGIGNYFKVDPVIVRIAFIVLTLMTGGFFLLAYLAMWLLIPTAGSTASQPGEVVQENLSDLSARVRNFTGVSMGASGSSSGSPTGPTNGGNGGNGGNGAPNGTNMVSTQAGAAHRVGIGPMILIGLGVFFLLGNVGFFHLLVWHAFWPILLIVLGFMLLSRRNR